MLTEALPCTQESVDVSLEEMDVVKSYEPEKVIGRQGTFAKHFHSFLMMMKARPTKSSRVVFAFVFVFFSLNQTRF